MTSNRTTIGWARSSALALLATATFAPEASARRGCEVTVYEHISFGGEALTLRDDVRFVGPRWNDRVSSLVVHRGIWVFYWDAEYLGEAREFAPGTYAYVGDRWNDQFSSARCIRPTG